MTTETVEKKNSSGSDVLTAMAFKMMLSGEYHKAIYWLRRALEMNPADVHALNNQATCLKMLGREPEAIAIYERVARERPDYIPARNNLAFCYLRHGNFSEGWKWYRYRTKVAQKHSERTIINPATGEVMGEDYRIPSMSDLEGKDLAIMTEQGIGDELFFLRFVPHIMANSFVRSVWYYPTEKLRPIMRLINIPFVNIPSSPHYHEIAKQQPVAVALGDLPLMLGHDDSWFPSTLTITPDPISLASIRPGLLGVTWTAGNAAEKHQGGLSKAIPPAALGDALRGWQGEILIIQRDIDLDDLRAFRNAIGMTEARVFMSDHLDPAGELNRLLVDALLPLDEYVGVSNTNMHLMAALGRTARVMVPHPAEWRWMASGEESPWFPGFKTYRQDVMGWDDCLGQLRQDLGL